MILIESFNIAVQEAIAIRDAGLPPKGRIVSADELIDCLSEANGAARKKFADDLVLVVASIQGLRMIDPSLDSYLRDLGIVTRVRGVR